jgi:hypothetical protein
MKIKIPLTQEEVEYYVEEIPEIKNNLHGERPTKFRPIYTRTNR